MVRAAYLAAWGSCVTMITVWGAQVKEAHQTTTHDPRARGRVAGGGEAKASRGGVW